MRVHKVGLLSAVFGLAGLLAGCGHSDPGTPTLSVSCDGSLLLAGATQLSAAATSSNGTTLTFPDPNNANQTGTLPIQPGRSCTITPVLSGKNESGDNSHGSGH